MKKIIIMAVTLLLISMAGLSTAAETQSILRSYNFDERKASEDWSSRKTFVVGKDKRLGLFNNRNKRYSAATTLTINDIPAGKKLEIRFDMLFIGSWDNEGKLADRFTVTVVDGPQLLNMTEFPCTLIDNDDNRPLGNDGFVKVGERERPYWIRPISVSVPSDAVKDGSVSIEFKGFLTGRKTEFWALDNVTVATD